MTAKQKVTLNLPWTDEAGKNHKQGDTVEVERAVANSLIHLGRAVRAADKKQGA